ncbi:MAG: hypothetical protein V1750_09255, partial [Acidobacteriota bacterium]
MLLFAGAAQAGDAPVRVSATASASEVSVGQAFTVEVRGEGPAGTIWDFPAAPGDEKLELQAELPTPGATPTPGAQRYRAAAFVVTDARVPAIKVRYRLPGGASGEVQTAPIQLQITTLLPKDPAEHKLADIRSPVGLPLGASFGALVATAVVALGASG